MSTIGHLQTVGHAVQFARKPPFAMNFATFEGRLLRD
jgi:hypothetical protein